MVLCRRHQHAIFGFGFAKSDRSNLDPTELRTFCRLADVLPSMPRHDIEKALAHATLEEVTCHG